jgi:DNA-directed RNA polymerase specialized sigma24 family protein
MQEIGDDESPGSEESADNLVSEFQQDQLLREALSELPPRCRQLVQMLFFETPARPYLRVARDLKLAPGSIGFIRRRCLDKLRERLEKLGFQ